MIHVVFNEADIKVLEEAIQLDEGLKGEIEIIRDDYAVGPIANGHEPEGWQNRRNWWKQVIDSAGVANPEETLNMVDDIKTLYRITKKLDEIEGEKLWIWAAQNKHDVSGYYWVISRLAPYKGRVYILYLNNLPFINDKGSIFYPQSLSQIPPKEFLKAKKLARPVTASEFEVDSDEWIRLGKEEKSVRLLEGGKKLIQFDEDFYDLPIGSYIHGDFAKASRIIQLFFAREKETTGDLFLLWRLKILADKKGYEVKGDMAKGAKDFELRDPLKPSLKKKLGEEEEVAG